ncbi:hypothetical protein JWV37_04195 [Sulfurospirillum sp. T05]|uniref:Uncharacterized protein n=1 Tax=Sulfurospirillum tamanense TaxID=2813362 RepID=A0ABS2WQL8_9BACT|nr:hypothetical protein [Sulfurospirillum tamanensis]MBN2963974.1 hypothetical protein [Sulfurospirillum tamanensis]
MDELLRMSVFLHLVFVALTFAVAALHVSLLWFIKEAQRLGKKIHTLIPVYYFLLSCLFFTGLIAWAALHFYFSHAVVTMVVVWVLMLGGSMKAYSLFKRTKTTNAHEAQQRFVAFAKKKYLFDIFVLGLLVAIA